jgi:hypothetical protein
VVPHEYAWCAPVGHVRCALLVTDILSLDMVDDGSSGLGEGNNADGGRHKDLKLSDGGGIRFSFAPRHWRGLLRLRRAIRRAQREQDLDADSPPLVVLTDLSAQLLAHARLLSAEDREDDEAVSELVRLADGNRHALQVAALGARQKGEHHESSWADRSHRLLQAAIAEGTVAPVPESKRTRLALLDEFAELPVADQWRWLTELEPRLADLTGSLPVEQLARHLTSTEVLDLPPEQRGPIRTARQVSRERLKSELTPLVGPQSSTDHPVLRSQIAFRAALEYLMDIDDNCPHPEGS